MCRRKTSQEWSVMYWFHHKAYSAVIRWLIWVCMKRIENWDKNPPSVVLPTHFSIRFLMFHLLLPKFVWVFSMFLLMLLPVAILVFKCNKQGTRKKSFFWPRAWHICTALSRPASSGPWMDITEWSSNFG